VSRLVPQVLVDVVARAFILRRELYAVIEYPGCNLGGKCNVGVICSRVEVTPRRELMTGSGWNSGDVGARRALRRRALDSRVYSRAVIITIARIIARALV